MGWEDSLASGAPVITPADEPVLWEAIVATDPTNSTDPVFVTIAGKDDDLYRYGPCPWSPRIHDADEYATPTRGDRALVAFSDDGSPWVIQWWPYE